MNDALTIIEKEFSIILVNTDTDINNLKKSADLNHIKNRIQDLIQRLLDNDLNGLMNLLYRIDISEQKFKIIVAKSPPKSIASQISDLIIERQLKKIITRSKYKKF